MDKRTFGAGAVALALLTMGTVFGGGAAYADAGAYTPDEPTEPSLAGSSAVASCVGDVPVINYNVVLTDPDDIATGHDATLVFTGSGTTTSIPLGTLQNDQLSGSVLWPGADTNGDGVADSWPGWLPSGDSWVETDGNFRWTRGDVQASIHVNPSIDVALSYPSGGDCEGHGAGVAAVSAVNSESTDGNALARTGGEVGTVIAAGGIGALLLVGGVLLTRRRNHRA